MQAEAVSPLRNNFWFENMANCPDLDLKNQVFNRLISGVDIGCTGPPSGGTFPNWPSADELSDDVTKSINANLALGRVVGPWTSPPIPQFVSSPLGAFRKPSGKVRVIHDLSFPPGQSINDFIDPEAFSLQYVTVDQVAQACAEFDEPPYLAKSDLSNAFQHVLVQPRHWHKLGFKWQGKYYAHACLPFGCRSAPYWFDVMARGLEYMAKTRGSSPLTWHYLDDTVTCSATRQSCQQSIDIFNTTAKLAGFTLQDSKCTSASQIIEFLGIEINTIEGTLSITQSRMDEIITELKSWQNCRVCTKRQLLSIIGKLSFAARVVRSGRTFLRRLIELSKSVKYLHYKIKLNRSARADLNWWIACLATHNGVNIFPTEWVDDDCEVLYSDASNVAMGAVCNDDWTVYPYTGSMRELGDTPIHCREMMAVCVGVSTFASRLSNKKVLLMVDNQAVCHSINAGTTRCPTTMNMVRSLYFTLCKHNIECKARYIHTHDNTMADALSRLDVPRFKSVCQSASPAMTFPIDPEYMCNE